MREAEEAARRLADLVADGDYVAAVSMCAHSRLSAADLQSVVQDYGRTVIRTPPDWGQCLSLLPVTGSDPPAWSVWAPLWTQEEGRSDLTLQMTVTQEPAGPAVELNNVRVP